MDNKAGKKDPATLRESFTELLGLLANNSAAVFHDAIELVIQRIREKVRVVRGGVITVTAGAIISLAAFMSLCASLIIELTSYMTFVMAALVTGAMLALIVLSLPSPATNN